MFEIDKRKFGTFVSELRKEKGYTQKELAEKLYISDKAVSKWETGSSIPDTALLIPLSELLGVTVMELLLCERRNSDAPMDAGQVENVVKTALSYSDGKYTRAYQTASRWPFLFVCALIVGILGLLLNLRLQLHCNTLITGTLLTAIFGAYFCFFAKTTLPAYYDENRCGLYYDGPIRMNVPGITFNNHNWPHIVKAIRLWACLFLAVYPIINLVMNRISTTLWMSVELYVFLVLYLGGLFLPIFILGKKHE